MNPPVICDYQYTEDTYKDYYRIRSMRSLRFLGGFLLVFGILFTPVGFMFFTAEPGIESILTLLFALALVAGGIAMIATGKMPMRMAPSTVAEFFGRHGANINAERPWAYREIVQVDDDGISVTYGPVDAAPDVMLSVKKRWNEWDRVIETPDYVIALTKTDMGSPLRSLFGVEFILRLEERNQYEDAVFPKARIRGIAPDELAVYLTRRIKKR